MGMVNWKRLGITAVTLCGVGALIYGVAAYRDYDSGQGDLNRYAGRLEGARSDAREAGLAIEISDILTPERKAGLERYERLLEFEEYVLDNRDLREALMLPHMAKTLPGVLKSEPEVFDIFFTATAIEDLSFPKDWELGLLSPAIKYNTVNLVAQFATTSAVLAFNEGDREGAMRLIEAGVHVASEIGDEPVTESVFAWASSSNRLARTVYRMTESDPTDRDTVDTALKSMERLVYPQPFTSLLRGDILCYIVTARKFDEYDEFEVFSLRLSVDDRSKAPEGEIDEKVFCPSRLDVAPLVVTRHTLHKRKGAIQRTESVNDLMDFGKLGFIGDAAKLG